ncbi:MAG: hypothetical protein ACK5RC_08480 [Curvibacter sp.]|jgi:hypothetical protein|nr:hypothetical protein [Curvibacter sp.]
MLRPRSTTRNPRWLLPGTALLVLALLWAQALGLAHRVLHAHGPAAGGSGLAHAHDHGHGHSHSHSAGYDAHAPHGLLAHLLAPAGEEEGCRLYDPVAQDVPASVPQLLLPTALPLLPAWVVLQALQPRPCVAFVARGPPVSR